LGVPGPDGGYSGSKVICRNLPSIEIRRIARLVLLE
jgi:hypothetical protein